MLGEDDQSAGRPKANPKADAAESRTEGAAGVQSGRHRGAPEAIRTRLKRFPVATERNAPGTALARRDTAVSTVGVLAQLLADRLSPAPRVPVERKVLLNLREAAEYSGMPKAWLLREIKAGELKAIKAGGWRIRRSELLQL